MTTTDTDTTYLEGYTYSSSYITQHYPKIRSPEVVTDVSVLNTHRQFEARQPRFELLENYYKGKHRFPESTSGSMVVSNLCGYITKALKGYLVGIRPKYVARDDDVYGQQIVKVMNDQNKWLTDSELVQDMSVYGRAFELVYRDRHDPRMPKSVRVSPRDAYVAYAGDVEQDSVFGAVRYYEVDENQVKHYRLYLYTVTDVQVWTSSSADGPWSLVEGPTPHGMGRVPLIEYANNQDYMGDFEQIIPLQDAYNQLLSDRLDDKTAFAQAMLRISGTTIGDTVEEIEDGLQKLKEAKVLQLDSDSTADYLVKTMDETGVQTFQDQLKNDIHKEAMVPDLSDEQFANNASGVSMAYKLFGTDQMVADKMAQYEKGFKRRCKLYDAVMFNSMVAPGYTAKCDIGTMSIRFVLNSPQDLSYMTSALATAVGAGYLSKRTATESLTIVPDADLEWERIDAERDADTAQQKAVFEDDYAVPGGEDYSTVKVVSDDEDDYDRTEEFDTERRRREVGGIPEQDGRPGQEAGQGRPRRVQGHLRPPHGYLGEDAVRGRVQDQGRGGVVAPHAHGYGRVGGHGRLDPEGRRRRHQEEARSQVRELDRRAGVLPPGRDQPLAEGQPLHPDRRHQGHRPARPRGRGRRRILPRDVLDPEGRRHRMEARRPPRQLADHGGDVEARRDVPALRRPRQRKVQGEALGRHPEGEVLQGDRPGRRGRRQAVPGGDDDRTHRPHGDRRRDGEEGPREGQARQVRVRRHPRRAHLPGVRCAGREGIPHEGRRQGRQHASDAPQLPVRHHRRIDRRVPFGDPVRTRFQREGHPGRRQDDLHRVAEALCRFQTQKLNNHPFASTCTLMEGITMTDATADDKQPAGETPAAVPETPSEAKFTQDDLNDFLAKEKAKIEKRLSSEYKERMRKDAESRDLERLEGEDRLRKEFEIKERELAEIRERAERAEHDLAVTTVKADLSRMGYADVDAIAPALIGKDEDSTKANVAAFGKMVQTLVAAEVAKSLASGAPADPSAGSRPAPADEAWAAARKAAGL